MLKSSNLLLTQYFLIKKKGTCVVFFPVRQNYSALWKHWGIPVGHTLIINISLCWIYTSCSSGDRVPHSLQENTVGYFFLLLWSCFLLGLVCLCCRKAFLYFPGYMCFHDQPHYLYVRLSFLLAVGGKKSWECLLWIQDSIAHLHLQKLGITVGDLICWTSFLPSTITPWI